jgi:alcohol/geraniol dehydrogenase (NADP+)
MSINAYAAKKSKARLEPFSYEPAPLGEFDVEIAITHCGICHSDVHLADGDWGDVFPLVPGHEIIGTVAKAGPKSVVKLGARVGVGWQCSSCGECEWCERGEENLCPTKGATCEHHFGGFAERIVVDSRFAFPIPEKLSSESAAPLLCGGTTVYAPLKRYAKRGSKVGVVGIGGLGHLAVQFAKAMGCDVTAFSHSPEKETEAKQFGAARFLASPKEAAGSLDLIISTVHTNLDWASYLAALRPNGVLCQVGAVAEPMSIPAFSFIVGQKCVSGSSTGSVALIKEMLLFAAKHNISARTEVVPMKDVNLAMEKTRKGLARYRMVLRN